MTGNKIANAKRHQLMKIISVDFHFDDMIFLVFRHPPGRRGALLNPSPLRTVLAVG